MDIIQDISTLNGIISNGLLVTATGTVSLGILIRRRTRSIHPILSRLWSLFVEKKDCDDPDIDRFLKERTALMQFRFITRIHAETLSQSHKVINFAKHWDIDPDLISASGKYFDATVPALKEKLPSDGLLGTASLASAAFIFVTVVMFFGALGNLLVVRMNDSGTWFLLNADRATPLFHSGVLGFDQCKKTPSELATASGFSSTDVALLCQTKHDDRAARIKSDLPAQRFLMGYLAGFGLYVATPLFFFAYRGFSARRLREKLEKAKAVKSAEQLETAADTKPAPVNVQPVINVASTPNPPAKEPDATLT